MASDAPVAPPLTDPAAGGSRWPWVLGLTVGPGLVIAAGIFAATRGDWSVDEVGELVKTVAAFGGVPLGLLVGFIVERRKSADEWKRQRHAAKEDRDAELALAERERASQRAAEQRQLFAQVLQLGFQAVSMRQPVTPLYNFGGRVLLVKSVSVRRSFVEFVEAVEATRAKDLSDEGRAAAWDVAREKYLDLEANIHEALGVSMVEMRNAGLLSASSRRGHQRESADTAKSEETEQ